jgi:hypothetical protein
MFAIVSIVVVSSALALAGGYYYLRTRTPREEKQLFFRCPKCRQKLRYSAQRAGKLAACPRCHEYSLLPKSPSRLDSGALLVGRRLMSHAS